MKFYSQENALKKSTTVQDHVLAWSSVNDIACHMHRILFSIEEELLLRKNGLYEPLSCTTSEVFEQDIHLCI